jgi:glutathione S-transferase
MKLFHTPTSPFVRKVMVAAHELGLVGRIETTFLRPSPLAVDATLSRENPLSKIPVLITDDGMTIFDSRVICEYLDTLHPADKLVPPAGPERWRVLRTQALADGVLEAGVHIFYERLHRPSELQWQAWLDGQSAKVSQGLAALDEQVSSLRGPRDLAQIAVACTVGWLEFRDILPGARARHGALFAWYDEFRERPSMTATTPVA